MLNPNPDALAESEEVNSCAQGILVRLMGVGRLVSPAIPLPDPITLAAWAIGVREGLLEVLAREVALAWSSPINITNAAKNWNLSFRISRNMKKTTDTAEGINTAIIFAIIASLLAIALFAF